MLSNTAVKRRVAGAERTSLLRALPSQAEQQIASGTVLESSIGGKCQRAPAAAVLGARARWCRVHGRLTWVEAIGRPASPGHRSVTAARRLLRWGLCLPEAVTGSSQARGSEPLARLSSLVLKHKRKRKQERVEGIWAVMEDASTEPIDSRLQPALPSQARTGWKLSDVKSR